MSRRTVFTAFVSLSAIAVWCGIIRFDSEAPVAKAARAPEPTQNKQLAEAFYANVKKGDFPLATAVFADELTWVEPSFPGFEGGTFTGKDSILKNVLGKFVGTWTDLTVTPERISDAGEHVVVHGSYKGKHKASGRPFESRFIHTWTFRDGKAVKFEMLSDSVPMFRAAGTPQVAHKTVKVGDLDIFYREAGPKDAPVILLLHGFPSSSQMFRNLIPALADKYRVIAPDYPGFGNSSMPARDKFAYTFDSLADVVEKFTEKLELKKYALYVQDYGAPVGYRLATKHPERVSAIVVQNGNAYEEGLDNDFWKPIKAYWKEPKNEKLREQLRPFTKLDATKWQYTHGLKNPELVSPDAWTTDQYFLDRKGNDDIQLDLFLSYGSNPPLYPKWQEYFRTHQPPVLIAWGKHDSIFPPAGAEPYKKDLKTIEYHLLDAGHFALETNGNEIASLMREFLGKHGGK